MTEADPKATSLINVALLPSRSVATVVIDLAESLPLDAPLRVDGQNFEPHLTVYMARFPLTKGPEVVKKVATIAMNTRSFDLSFAGFNFTGGNYYEALYRNDSNLRGLQQATIDAVASLRSSPGRPLAESYFGQYDRAQQASARETGYDLSGDGYRPHITIGRLNSKPPLLPGYAGDLSFEVSLIGVFEADQNGAARRCLARFELGD